MFHGDRNIVNILRCGWWSFRIEYVRDRFDRCYALSGRISLPQLLRLYVALCAARPVGARSWSHRINPKDGRYLLHVQKTREPLEPVDPTTFQIFLTDTDDHLYALASAEHALRDLLHLNNGQRTMNAP